MKPFLRRQAKLVAQNTEQNLVIQKQNEERTKLKVAIKQLEEIGSSASAIKELKDRLAKLPKPATECQPLKDLNGLVSSKIQIKKRYQELDQECNLMEEALAKEEFARAELLQKELKQAEEEHADLAEE